MKFILLAILILPLALAVEREEDSGSAVAEETTFQVPVTSVKPIDNDDNDDDDDSSESSSPTSCSKTLCSAMCRRTGCQESLCLDYGRCACICTRTLSPQDFFGSVFGSAYRPRVRVPLSRPQMYPGFPDLSGLGFPRIEGLSSLDRLFSELEKGTVHSKTSMTMQRLCDTDNECEGSCTNCTSVKCVDSLCQCTGCNRTTGLESRKSAKEELCRTASNCEEHCTGCSKVTCRYGACECDKCTETVDEKSTTTTTETPSTQSSTVEASTFSIDVLSIKPNETASLVSTDGQCFPKKCNHACWERQCSKWNCKDNKCECDGCPNELSVMVTNVNGTQEARDEDKYEIIF